MLQQDVGPDAHAGGARHIMTIAQDLKGGGVERAMLRLARGWLDAGRRVTLVAGSLTGPLAAELPAGLDTIVLGDGRYARLAVALPAAVRRLRPDTLFVPGNHYTGVAAWTRLRLGQAAPPIVAKVSNAPTRVDHGRLVDAGHRAWLALHGRFLDHAVAMTDATARDAARLMGMAGRMSVIANPPAVPIPEAAAAPLPAGRFLLGVGRLVAQKRWDRLIAALPLLADRSIELVILGEGDGRAMLEAQVARLGLGARVRMPGNAADPLPAMAGAALVVLTSDYEGVPGVLREALSVGTPVVSTRSSVAVDEIVTDPSLGTVVPLDDAQALVAALDRWLSPGAVRPAPVPPPGSDSAGRYLDLFDRLVVRR